MDYVLVGSGGHSKVVVDILQSRQHNVIGFFDDSASNTHYLNIPVLGSIDEISTFMNSHRDVFWIITIGNNITRSKIVEELRPLNLKYGRAIHQTAIIGSNVVVNEGSVVMPNVVINADVIIGSHSILNTACTVDHDCEIGEFVHISPGANLAGGVHVGSFSQIGIGASVIQSIHIGSSTVIGAGACVVNDIESNVEAFGCPARMIKTNKE